MSGAREAGHAGPAALEDATLDVITAARDLLELIAANRQPPSAKPHPLAVTFDQKLSQLEDAFAAYDGLTGRTDEDQDDE